MFDKESDRSVAANTGDRTTAANTCDRSMAINTGDRSAAINTGDRSVACVNGTDSVAIAVGYNSRVKGNVGCAIVCVERGEYNGKSRPILAIKSAIVDGNKIKPDTWYTVENEEWVETEED